MMNNKHWTVKKDADHIVWLGLDRKNETVNTINEEVLDELNGILQDITTQSDAAGLIIYSEKTKGFIAGADVHSFRELDDKKHIADFLRKGQTVFSRLEAMSIPTLAMIRGFCMGGGLELALACDYRIVTDDKDTRLGVPEILLGFHPGWGGTVRLARLLGGFHALSALILTGGGLSGARAKRLGLVDDVVPFRQLKRAALYYMHHKPPKHKPTFIQSLTNHKWARPLIAQLLYREVAKKVNKEHYPAPYGAIHLWEKEGGFDERAYLKEAESVERLVSQNSTAENLIRVFFLRERLKGFAKHTATNIQHVHVIGAGVMGGDIAAWCASRGLRVTLQDKSYAHIAPAVGRAYAFYKKKMKHTRDIQAAMDRLIPDPEGFGIARADLVIEAVVEDRNVKQAIFRAVETQAKPRAILATNTSSIPLDEISEVMKQPERLVGIHFFNPVAKMELIEIVSSKQTNPQVAAEACRFAGQIGKLPLPVQSSPGFLINRILMPYLMESVALLEEGFAPEVVDQAAKNFGMLMGPVELADAVGMDVCLAVAENLSTYFGGGVPQKLREMVLAGKLGRKSGEGFYVYKNGKPVKHKTTEKPSQEIADRLILRMINEASACLREGVVSDDDLLDAGMVFGTGFAPFRGGLMHYAKAFGEDKLNALFTHLETQYGERFKV